METSYTSSCSLTRRSYSSNPQTLAIPRTVFFCLYHLIAMPFLISRPLPRNKSSISACKAIMGFRPTDFDYKRRQRIAIVRPDSDIWYLLSLLLADVAPDTWISQSCVWLGCCNIVELHDQHFLLVLERDLSGDRHSMCHGATGAACLVWILTLEPKRHGGKWWEGSEWMDEGRNLGSGWAQTLQQDKDKRILIHSWK